VPYRARAEPFGVKCTGAFPIVRAGGVIGTLNLYFGTTDAFDPAYTAGLDDTPDGHARADRHACQR
jgi:hypothetical protein